MLWAYTTFQFEGYHRWLNAPDEVAFLRFKHRHIFHCKVHIEQLHHDRDIEYILCRHWLIGDVVARLDREDLGSCEMIAEAIGKEIQLRYTDRLYKVDVSEDGENGALLES